MDQNTGKMKGFAHVQFSDPAAAAKAVETLNGTDFGGRPLRLDMAGGRPQRDAQPRTPRGESDGTTVFVKVRRYAVVVLV